MSKLFVHHILLLVANRFFAAVEFYATGSFAYIPAYMPSETSCVVSSIPLPQATMMQTNDHIHL